MSIRKRIILIVTVIAIGLAIVLWCTISAPRSGLLQLGIFKALNHRPIEFYGRAVDQFGEPVANASVRGTVLENTGSDWGEMKVTTVTDEQGYFAFSRLSGEHLGIGIEKDGYEYRRKENSFTYSHFWPENQRHSPDRRTRPRKGVSPIIHVF